MVGFCWARSFCLKQFRQYSAISSTHKSKLLLVSGRGKKEGEEGEGEENYAYLWKGYGLFLLLRSRIWKTGCLWPKALDNCTCEFL